LDEECYVNCKTMKTQSIDEMNKCKVAVAVDEDIGDANCMHAIYPLHVLHADRHTVIAAIPGQKMTPE
jgi:hypothetical protein